MRNKTVFTFKITLYILQNVYDGKIYVVNHFVWYKKLYVLDRETGFALVEIMASCVTNDLVKIKQWRKRNDRYYPHIYVKAYLIFPDNTVSGRENYN